MSTQKATEKEEEYFARLELEKKKKIIEQERGRLAEEEKKRLQEHEASMHPGCGGVLYWEKSGLRVAWIFDALPVRIYDAEGCDEGVHQAGIDAAREKTHRT